ncbi:hypothetical protein DS885_05665 [Psychromonas sp. B3M02]|uniref:2-keto-4-pentenoate hydratase n=2 Tax=unclassified Psychromonas TaxID=2614957 RepID=UPI000DEA5A07|nr:fumarylacetoacetate hydrolase family protein [Psychromonas sp. B3M02]RBW46995.1 hypothetical protein DS885_05665 [Psychromonas sp. B3M02]
MSTEALTSVQINELAQALSSARKEIRIVEGFPGPIPNTLKEAYQVQDASIEALDQEIVGWKVGMIPPDLRDTLGDVRVLGPVFKDVHIELTEKQATGEAFDLPVFAGGFIAIEPELVVEINQEIKPGSINTADGVTHLVKAVYAGIEMASSPVVDLNSYGPTAIISDIGNQYGVIVGTAIEDWENAITKMETSTSINGELINTAATDGILNGPMSALAFMIDCCAERGITLPAGSICSTGAITGVHEALVGATSTVKFGDVCEMNFTLVDNTKS